MSAEDIKTLLDYVLAFLIPIFLGMFSWILRKLNNVYTKAETKEMIDLKVSPLMESLDRHSRLIEKQTQVLEKLNDSLQILHIDISVVKEKVSSLEKE